MPAKTDAVDEFDRAAAAIWDAEYLVIVAGPSFYESSESSVFASERCDHVLLQTSPEKFYGFWGEYFNRYADRTPHDGYGILRKWRENYFDVYSVDQRRKGSPGGPKSKAEDGEKEDALPRCYVITTTIDGSFGRSGFPKEELYELCGNITHWQCWIPCKQEVWPIDAHVRFDVDRDLKEAKPIKWVTDNRPPVVPEVWTVVDSDDGGSGDELPPLPDKPAEKGLDKAASREAPKKNKPEKTKPEMAAPVTLGRLGFATPIPLHVQTQEVYPNMGQFIDHFMSTPTSNLVQVPTFIFTKPAAAGAPEVVEPTAPPSSGPEQPYILAPRVNHCLNHLIGLHTQRYCSQRGTLGIYPLGKFRELRRARWQSKQRFFDPSAPDLEHRRKQHVFYNVSIVFLDATQPAEHPALQVLALGSQTEGFPVDPAPSFILDAVPSLPPLRDRTSSMQSLQSPFASPGRPTSGRSTSQWEQGSENTYYFSYLPVSSTFMNLEEAYFDSMHIEFPTDGAGKPIPSRGKVSVIIECCEYPEPKPKESPQEGKKDKKSKKEEPTAPTHVKLDPIPEPTLYTVTQLIGQFRCPKSPTEAFALTLTTRKGHLIEISCNASKPSSHTIRSMDIEVPIAKPEDRDPLKGTVRFEVVAADPKAASQAKKKKKAPHPVPNYQRCVTCGEFARPNVVMDHKKDIRVIVPPKKPYQQWETAMAKALRGPGCSLVILEMGCEKKVDASRKLSEKLFKLAKSSGRCTFIRLSTEDLEKKAKGSQADGDKLIPIIGPILNSLTNIDRRMQEMKRRK